MNYELILKYIILGMIGVAVIISITYATPSEKDNQIGEFLSKFLNKFLDLLEKIVPFYKRNK